MRIAIVIQARTRSTRLPGKVLLPLAGRPMLERMLARVRAAREADHVLVATTTDPADSEIVELCARLDVDCLRGHPDDCLDRHLQAAERCGVQAVVKIPSDCPLIDPAVIDRVLAHWRSAPAAYDYLSNLHPGSWPDGQDVEVIAMAALRRAAREARDPFDREHTTPFLWSQPGRFRLGNVLWDAGLDLSHAQRWVVDWIEDYRFVREIFERLLPSHGPCFAVEDVLHLLQREPQLAAVNASRHGYRYWAQQSDPFGARSPTYPEVAQRAAWVEETRT